ncbi:putative ripening-related protein 2 [Rutidosis leptorrhynchoides]|uniref:putative ripening-related protein 2 n=1 Tax=Rutidosis leptorrhynchoides TaxID=125765 RepID=UPI003A99F8CD
MKQSTIILLVIFSLLITLLTTYVEGQKHGRKLIRKTLTPYQLVTSFDHDIHASSNELGATLMITDFEQGGESGGPAECDGVYNSSDLFLVSLSTDWYNNGQSCYKGVRINYSGNNAIALGIDECGDGCPDGTVVASEPVWRALQIPESEWGEAEVTWSFVD